MKRFLSRKSATAVSEFLAAVVAGAGLGIGAVAPSADAAVAGLGSCSTATATGSASVCLNDPTSAVAAEKSKNEN